MPEINLLKNELQDRTPISFGGFATPTFYVVIGLLVLELLGYGGLLIYNKQLDRQIREAELAMANINFEIGKVDKDRREAVSFQSRLANLDSLLKNHLYLSSLLGELEKSTYKPAVYNTLQLAEGENKLVLSGRIPSYTDLGKLILGLKASPNIRDVVLKSSGQKESAEGGYSFNVEITFDPKVLLK